MTTTAARTTKPFRFGVTVPVTTDMATWSDQVRRLSDLGFSTLLMPDVPHMQPAPGPTLALASALSNMRVGTWVIASPLRPAWSLAWEAHSISMLTGGRFELGLGAGRPGFDDELERLRAEPVSPAERLSRIRDTVIELRELDGPDLRTPIAMAVRGRGTCALAAELADTVTFALTPDDTRADAEQLVRSFRSDRDVELALHISVVGDTPSPFMAPPGIDTAALHEMESLSALPGEPAAAVAELVRRREELGFSYVVVGANCADAVAPIVAELAGT